MASNYDLSPERKAYVESNQKLSRFIHKYFPFFFTGFKQKWIDITRLELTLPNLGTSFNNTRLLQISDIHLGSWTTPERLLGVINIVNRLQPDIIVHTGDLVSYELESYISALVNYLSKLKAPLGVFTILGNHDYWNGQEKIIDIYKRSGIKVLTNTIHTLTSGQDHLHLAGADCAYEGLFTLEPLLEKLPKTGCAIILSHEPDVADQTAAADCFDLQLSGHSHGGQMILPFIGPVLKINWAKKYTVGLHQIGSMLQYTNRGIGSGEIPIRINCPPEISVFTLKSPHA